MSAEWPEGEWTGPVWETSRMPPQTNTIPDDMAARVARLINEAEDMRQQAADDLKQIYADLREELRGLGWHGKHVSAEVAALKGAIGEMRLGDKAKEKREEKGERVDDYVSLLTRARAREGNNYAAARRSDAGLNILTKHEDITNGDRSNERDSQQHVGRPDDEQHNAPPVPRPDGRGEGADAGAEGQGAGASGVDRSGRPVAGAVDCQDEDGRSRHVGGEARYEVIQPETAEELQNPVPHAPGATARSGGDGSTVRGARTEADAVTAGETAPHSQSDDGAFAEVKGSSARLANADGVEPSSSVHPSDQPSKDQSNEVAISSALRAGLAEQN